MKLFYILSILSALALLGLYRIDQTAEMDRWQSMSIRDRVQEMQKYRPADQYTRRRD